MTIKKSIAALLAATTLLSMSAVNAFAAPTQAQATGNALTVGGELEEDALEIDVTLPTVTALTIDPYLAASTNTDNKQIFTDEMPFTVGSTATAKYSVKLVGYSVNDLKADGKTSSEITLAKAAIDNTSATLRANKEVYLYVAVEESGKYVNKQALTAKADVAYTADNADTTVTSLASAPVTLTPDGGLAKDGVLNVKILGDVNVKGDWKVGDKLSVTTIYDVQPIFVAPTTGG